MCYEMAFFINDSDPSWLSGRSLEGLAVRPACLPACSISPSPSSCSSNYLVLSVLLAACSAFRVCVVLLTGARLLACLLGRSVASSVRPSLRRSLLH